MIAWTPLSPSMSSTKKPDTAPGNSDVGRRPARPPPTYLIHIGGGFLESVRRERVLAKARTSRVQTATAAVLDAVAGENRPTLFRVGKGGLLASPRAGS